MKPTYTLGPMYINTSGYMPSESSVDEHNHPITTYAQKRAAQPKKE